MKSFNVNWLWHSNRQASSLNWKGNAKNNTTEVSHCNDSYCRKDRECGCCVHFTLKHYCKVLVKVDGNRWKCEFIGNRVHSHTAYPFPLEQCREDLINIISME